jgi:peptidylamidoglycolate lyase
MSTRRQFLTSSAAAAATLRLARSESSPAVLGHGQHRYRVVPSWGQLGTETPVKNCHGLVTDREGHIVLLTDHTANNVVIYDKSGKLVSKWGTTFPGAHGLSIVTEGEKQFLYITCTATHRVAKTTLDGKTVQEWRWPEQSGKYTNEGEYRPSWTLHAANGDFYTLDGYGKDFITHHNAKGDYVGVFGGAEGGIVHWGPHGGMMDEHQGQETLLIAMSDQKHLLRLDLAGKKLAEYALPGGNPRQIRKHKEHYFVGHLADNWPEDRKSRGFISVLDKDFKVVANIGGTAPEYDDAGKLRPMKQAGEVFYHPHDVICDADDSLYVAQFDSGNTYPIKLERV